MFSKKFRIFIFWKNTQNCFAHNSATQYLSEVVLYSKQTLGYFLSPHIKTSWVIKQQNSCFLKILKNTSNFGRTVHTLDYAQKLKLEFSEVDIVWIKTGFWNFDEIPFPWKWKILVWYWRVHTTNSPKHLGNEDFLDTPQNTVCLIFIYSSYLVSEITSFFF